MLASILHVLAVIVLFIIVLSVLVVAHEWGHFIVARLSKMRVYEFGWGFPPRAFGVYKDPITQKWVWVWGRGKSRLDETVGGQEHRVEFPSLLLSVNWLPLGGFVKIKGENGEDKNDSDSFGHQKSWQKLATLLAGVVMNFIVAGILLSIGFLSGLPVSDIDTTDRQAIIVEPPAVAILGVSKDSAAKQAGIVFGDKVISVDGQPATSAEMFSTYIKEHNTKALQLVIEHAKTQKTVTITPSVLSIGSEPQLGVQLGDAGIVRFPWYAALTRGFTAAWFGFLSTFVFLYILIRDLVTGHGLMAGVGGPVGIASTLGQSAQLGWSYLISVAAKISLSLAVINVLPIPALDGGRALFVIIEWVTGKKVPVKYEQIAHLIGGILLLVLIVFVTWRDIVALF